MGFFDFFGIPDINRGLEEYHTMPGAVLLDVRTSQEYREGHIPGSQNVPLQFLDTISSMISSKQTPVFVYCYSGSRSSQAVKKLGKMGYKNVKNLGGISSYSGKVEH